MSAPRLTPDELVRRFRDGYVSDVSWCTPRTLQLRFHVRDGVDAAALVNTLRDAVDEYVESRP